MEPYWLRLLNQANFLVRVNGLAIRPYLRDRFRKEIHTGEYVWLDFQELSLVEDWVRSQSVPDINFREKAVKEVTAYCVKPSHSPREYIPRINPKKKSSGVIGGKLFSPLGQTKGLAAGNIRVQALLGFAKSRLGTFTVPTRYAQYLHTQPWLIRTKVKRLKPLQLMRANLIRLHYYTNVVQPNIILGRRPGLHQSYVWSVGQTEMEVVLHSDNRSQYRFAAHGLYRKLNVLLSR